jgi:hypothetical protein
VQDKGVAFKTRLTADMTKLDVAISKVVVRRVISNVAEQISAINSNPGNAVNGAGGSGGDGDGSGDGSDDAASASKGSGAELQVADSIRNSGSSDSGSNGGDSSSSSSSTATAAFGLSSTSLLMLIVVAIGAGGVLAQRKKISLMTGMGDEAWNDEERKQYARVDRGDTAGSGVEMAPLAR